MENRIDLKTPFVSILCLAGAAAGSYLLYSDMNTSSVRGIGKPVGRVEKRESTVRRKSSLSYVWSVIQPDEPLFQKDSVQTGVSSAATIRLPNGNLLDIGENSLVVMVDSTQLPIQFLRGTVVVHKADGDQRLTLGKDGRTKVEDLPIRLVKPEPLARLFVNGKDAKEITFSWEMRMRALRDPVTMQISTDRRFSSLNSRNITASDLKALSLTVALPGGTYFWRILSKNTVLSAARQLKVLKASPLLPTFPEDAQRVKTTPSNVPQRDLSVQFRWLGPLSSGEDDVDVSEGEHKIEVSRDPQFKVVAMNETINPATGMATLNDIPIGINYWRIRSRYGESTTFSSVRSFHFDKADMVARSTLPELAYPSMANPAPHTEFNLLDKKIPLEASWSEVEGAKAYEVTVYSDSKTDHKKKLMFRNLVEKTKMDLKALGPGDYLWTIRSTDKKKHFSRPIPWMRFSVGYGNVLSAPKVTSPEVQ